MLTFIDAQLAHEPERGDVVRDVLADLAEQMSNLQAQRHEAIGDFRIGLQGVLTASRTGKTVSSLDTHYTHYTRYTHYTHYTPTPTTPLHFPACQQKIAATNARNAQRAMKCWTCWGLLATQQLDFYDDIGQLDERQWLWLLKHKFGSRSNMVGIAHVYRNYHPRIAAVDELLRQTDRLINAIVYKLYGLTEEEVAIVEGR